MSSGASPASVGAILADLEGAGESGGLGWVRVNGSSTASSLSEINSHEVKSAVKGDQYLGKVSVNFSPKLPTLWTKV